MGLPARQPRQTDAVYQFVEREANGYKAEGFSRQRIFHIEASGGPGPPGRRARPD